MNYFQERSLMLAIVLVGFLLGVPLVIVGMRVCRGIRRRRWKKAGRFILPDKLPCHAWLAIAPLLAMPRVREDGSVPLFEWDVIGGLLLGAVILMAGCALAVLVIKGLSWLVRASGAMGLQALWVWWQRRIWSAVGRRNRETNERARFGDEELQAKMRRADERLATLKLACRQGAVGQVSMTEAAARLQAIYNRRGGPMPPADRARLNEAIGLLRGPSEGRHEFMQDLSGDAPPAEPLQRFEQLEHDREGGADAFAAVATIYSDTAGFKLPLEKIDLTTILGACEEAAQEAADLIMQDRSASALDRVYQLRSCLAGMKRRIEEAHS